MHIEELRISNQLVDIIPNTINRTLQINDLGSASDRQSNYSNTVKLPMTDRNKLIFEFLGVIGNTSRAPYKELPCSYSVNGIPLIINGLAVIEATSDVYEVVIYDGLIDLSERLKGKTISDLNYSDLNHFLNVPNFTNSFNNTEGYIYALGDFGISRYGIRLERQVPSLFTHTVWDKIFKEVNVNYYGEFFNENEDFKTEVITPPLGYEVQDIEPNYTNIGKYQTDSANVYQRSNDFIFQADYDFSYNTVITNDYLSFGQNGEITFLQAGRYHLLIDLNYTSNQGYNLFQALLNTTRIIKSFPLDGYQQSTTIDLTVSVNAGDTIRFKICGTNTGYNSSPENINGGENTIDNQYFVNYSASAEVQFNLVTGGFLIDFNEIMGDTPQIDIIKDIMQRYGLVLKPIKGSNDYTFIQFEELLNARSNAEDWSEKLVSINKESYGVKYAQENTAKYSYAEEIKIPSHDGSLIMDNSNADATKTLFGSIYTIPYSLRNYFGEPLYLVEVWEEKDEDGKTIIQPKEADISTFRIKYIENRNLHASFFDDSTAVTYTGEIPFLSLENMEMQYFLNVYYKAYGLAINTFKEVEATAYLNEVDIYNLDFFRLKYLQQTGKYYYLNNVQYKAGNEVSKVKLIELNEFSENQPPSSIGDYTYTMNYTDERNLAIEYFTEYATPELSDPENDNPYSIKFNSGKNPDIKLYNNGVEVIEGQDILISNYDLVVKDMGNLTNAHSATFEYQIADSGSQKYGNAVGKFTVKVRKYNNTAPVANAGDDVDVTIFSGQEQTPPFFASLNASNSTDDTTIVSLRWSIIQAPSGHTCSIENDSSSNTYLLIPNDFRNGGNYTIQLTVTDEFGATDTDTMTVNVFDHTNEIPSE